ncbi:S8 family serine peptidase [Sedimentibacter hydroxybenzoicus DSM 7310]|uniref:S8 family serine peptidase n=1 Tax=Sedimentibacter hydroxybenzoicus DSM 7310 TaxID=1123245 RepID=A0A974BJP8_SEDHY|nr:S8 family peptidase [Sedimentibacter hydroxybenzoicus]NYB74131.1 S8 family serine peptidase [Sedimentibacter hydroxybenzoicus DSM 7310]
MKKVQLIICILLIFSTISAIVISDCYSYNKSNPLLNKQWYLQNNGNKDAITESADYRDYLEMKCGADISATEMWKILLSHEYNQNVIVAVIDTGVDYLHEDLQDSIWINTDEIPGDGKDNDNNGYIDDIHGYNFCNDNANVLEVQQNAGENGHGTMCAGIISASDNNVGILGIAGYTNISIMSLKVLDSEEEINSGNVSSIIKAVKYAEANGAQICNLSLCIAEYDDELKETMEESDMLFVVPAGNGSGRGIDISKKHVFPASYKLDNMIVVANMNYNGRLNKSSNYGLDYVDVAAPGTCIISTYPQNSYKYASGTSMSTAVVTGIAAVLYGTTNDMTAGKAKDLICLSVDINEDLIMRITSGGSVNGENALKMVLGFKQ